MPGTRAVSEHAYRRVARVAAVIVTALAGIPLGVYGLTALPEPLVKSFLGAIVIAFALFSLSHWELPELKNDKAGYAFGLAAGLLGGAYNTQGPALVIYATMRRWPRDQFRVNLQSILLPTCGFILVNHWWQVPLYVGVRGLTTTAIPYGDRSFEVEFDFLAHALVIRTSDGQTKALALELAPVRVNAVAAGVVRTPLTTEADPEGAERFFAQHGPKLPVGRVADPSDVAKAYVYLMSDGFCTGHVLVSDGGQLLI